MTFLEQLGVTHTFTWISNEQSTYEFLIELRKKVEAHNLVLWNVGNRALGKVKMITFLRPFSSFEIFFSSHQIQFWHLLIEIKISKRLFNLLEIWRKLEFILQVSSKFCILS